jgi:hypothetical protein
VKYTVKEWETEWRPFYVSLTEHGRSVGATSDINYRINELVEEIDSLEKTLISKQKEKQALVNLRSEFNLGLI